MAYSIWKCCTLCGQQTMRQSPGGIWTRAWLRRDFGRTIHSLSLKSSHRNGETKRQVMVLSERRKTLYTLDGKGPTAVDSGFSTAANQTPPKKRGFISRRARYTSSMWGIAKKVLHKQAHRSQLQQLFTLWRDYQQAFDAPTPTVYSAVIVAYHLSQLHTLTLQMYRRYRQRYVESNVESDAEEEGDNNVSQGGERRATLQKIAYDMILKSAQKLGDVDTFMQVLSELEEQGITITRSHYESLMAACLAAGDEDKASKVLQQLEHLPGDSSPRLYRVMAKHRIEHKEFDKALGCIEELHTSKSLDSNKDAFLCEQLATAALHGYDLYTTKRCFELMRSMGTTFDLGTLQWLLYNSASLGYVPVAYAAFEMLSSSEAGHGIEPQEHHYSALIRASIVCHDWLRAFRLLSTMAARGVDPSPATVEMVARDLSMLLNIYLRSEHMGTYLLLLISKRNLAIDSIPSANVILWLLARTAVPQLAEEAVALLFSPSRSGETGVTLVPNQLTYEILLEAYSSNRAPNVEACESVLKTMKQAQFDVSKKAYDFLIRAYIYSKQLDDALATLKSSVAEGKSASRVLFELVGKTAARANDEGKVNEVLQLMETAGHPYTRRFLGYLRKQREGTLEDYTTEPMAAKDEENPFYQFGRSLSDSE